MSSLSLLPGLLMLLCAALARWGGLPPARAWAWFNRLSLASAAVALALLAGSLLRPHGALPAPLDGWLAATLLGTVVALLVQCLGTVIGAFSARYLQGEAGQRRYLGALAAVLAAVHLLLLADHWAVLIAGWALVGLALDRLLCFYPERPFALLAAHKKRLADRCADVLLLAAAGLAWHAVGSGSFGPLWALLRAGEATPALQASALLLVAAVLLRTAVLPVHGWLIQVMEAPTPVSGLLHAGVVNLGGFVLLRFAPLLEQAPAARWLLVAAGGLSAVLAGLVMLTRISIKVRLAWSTVAQMGFMVMEVGLGLYTLAALHLVGHSLYKAQAFLRSGDSVRQARLLALRGQAEPAAAGLLLAPVLALGLLAAVSWLAGGAPWPAWWTALLALAWAPLLWWPAAASSPRLAQVAAGALMLLGMAGVAQFAHHLPLGLHDAPHGAAGPVALAGMAALYLLVALMQLAPQALTRLRRWSYAGFYLDEAMTRLTLRLWPAPGAPLPAR